MFFVCDIGNSNIVCGCFQDLDLVAVIRVRTDQKRTVDEYRVLLSSLFSQKFGEGYKFSRAIISSVVPTLTPKLSALIEDAFGIKPHIVGPGTKTGLAIKTKDPSAVGSDRIVNAVAAKKLFGLPALVIDFGTAISFDLVDAESSYRGGIIAPGIEISLDALVTNTAKLPRVELECPAKVVGNDTISAMQSGIMFGCQAMIEGLIARVEEETGEIAHIIATGGSGKNIVAGVSRVAQYVPDLTLQGLRILLDLN